MMITARLIVSTGRVDGYTDVPKTSRIVRWGISHYTRSPEPLVLKAGEQNIINFHEAHCFIPHQPPRSDP